LLQHRSFRFLAENIPSDFLLRSFAETEPKNAAFAATGESLEDCRKNLTSEYEF
jgi:hypothetical protein